MSFLDERGLQHFWGRIKNDKFATKEDLSTRAKAVSYTVTIPTSGWSDTSPYCLNIVVEGLSEDDTPTITPLYTGDTETDQEMQKAWDKISMIVTEDNLLKVYAFEEIPNVEIPIKIQVISDGSGEVLNSLVTLTQTEYNELVANGEVNENTYYFIKEG